MVPAPQLQCHVYLTPLPADSVPTRVPVPYEVISGLAVTGVFAFLCVLCNKLKPHILTEYR